MDIRLPDGTILRGVPEGTSQEEIAQRLQAAGRPVPQEWLAQSREQKGRDAPGAVRGFASVMQGPTLGFADEIAGGVGGLVSAARGDGFASGYRNVRDFARGAAKQEQEDNPIFTTITRGAASLPLMLKGFAAKGTGALAQTAAAMKTGAAYSGAAALGGSEADTAGGMALDTAMGAGTGAATSGILTPVMRAAGGAATILGSKVSKNAAARAANAKLAEQLLRDTRGRVPGTDGLTALRQAQRQLERLGPEGRVIDAGGANTRQLLDTLAVLPGQTKQATEAAIRSRQATAGPRLVEAAERALKTSGMRLAPSMEKWVKERASAAQPLYSQLYKTDLVPDQELVNIVSRADDLGATALAQRIAKGRDLPYTLDKTTPQSWSMRDLDSIKQALDSQIAKKVNPQTGDLTPEGSSLVFLRDQLIRKLDDMTMQPTGDSLYRTARDAFSGPSQIMDAARKGQLALTRDDTAIRQSLAGLSQSEQEAFRIGAFEALRTKLGMRGGRTEIINMWQNPATADKLRAIFGDERSFRKFAAAAAAEGKMRGLETVGRGSQTAARQFGAGDLDVPAISDASRLVTGQGGLMGMLDAGAKTWNRVAMPEAMRDQMGRGLLAQGPAGQAQLSAMEQIMRDIARQRQQQANALGLLSTAAPPLQPSLLGF